jgi:hypothetical protein
MKCESTNLSQSRGSGRIISLAYEFQEAEALAPIALRDRAAWAARRLHADLSNFYLLEHRDVDGYLVTGKNSGTHWLKFMLSHAFAAEYNLPPPLHSSGRTSDDYVSHPKWPQKYPQTPRIGSSHNLPSTILSWPPVFHALRLPPTVVLVRDIQEALISSYVKWHKEMNASLADYITAPPPGRRHLSDVWWYIDFFNRWGRMAVRLPDQVLIVRYEDLQTEPKYWLTRVLQHYGVSLSEPSIEAGVAASGRERMRGLLDPDFHETIIPRELDRKSVRFSADEQALLRATLATHLKYSFGYGYAAENRTLVAGPSDQTESADLPAAALAEPPRRSAVS